MERLANSRGAPAHGLPAAMRLENEQAGWRELAELDRRLARERYESAKESERLFLSKARMKSLFNELQYIARKAGMDPRTAELALRMLWGVSGERDSRLHSRPGLAAAALLLAAGVRKDRINIYKIAHAANVKEKELRALRLQLAAALGGKAGKAMMKDKLNDTPYSFSLAEVKARLAERWSSMRGVKPAPPPGPPRLDGA